MPGSHKLQAGFRPPEKPHHVSSVSATAPDPMLSATSSNNHSLFSFGRSNGNSGMSANLNSSRGQRSYDDADDDDDSYSASATGTSTSAANRSTASFDFLPSVSFDDLQSSLESASTEFKLAQFPLPSGHGSILAGAGGRTSSSSSHNQTAPDGTSSARASSSSIPAVPSLPAITSFPSIPDLPVGSAVSTTSAVPATRIAMSSSASTSVLGSTSSAGTGTGTSSAGPAASNAVRNSRSGILRRPSVTGRQSSIPASIPTPASISDLSAAAAASSSASSASSAARQRRQSHYPPVSNSSIINSTIAKPPRKSVGPGLYDPEYSSSIVRRSSSRRRPSLASNSDRPSSSSNRSSLDSSGRLGANDTVVVPVSGSVNGSRATKARSYHQGNQNSQSSQKGLASSSSQEPFRSSASGAPRGPRNSSSNATLNSVARGQYGGQLTVASAGGPQQPLSPNKRVSAIGTTPILHPTHATGLGARTVSPTDARRMKRMSTMPPTHSNNSTNSVNTTVSSSSTAGREGKESRENRENRENARESAAQLTSVSLPPAGGDNRASSRSPSMLPRKTSTPSSSRTTPDPNRKSYSSGLSIGSSTSFNTVRTSIGSIQPRILSSGSMTGTGGSGLGIGSGIGSGVSVAAAVAGLNGITSVSSMSTTTMTPHTNTTSTSLTTTVTTGGGSSSRMPSPGKTLVSRTSVSNLDEDEDVPPVPAIPKAYESPKTSPGEITTFLERRRSNLMFDSSSIHSASTSSLVGERVEKSSEQQKQQKQKQQQQSERKDSARAKKKSLQPLRLPPINLMPLGTSTAAKIAALQEKASNSSLDRDCSPLPPSRLLAKTPTTPLTASRGSFFSRSKHDDDLADVSTAPRSSSSVHHHHYHHHQFHHPRKHHQNHDSNDNSHIHYSSHHTIPAADDTGSSSDSISGTLAKEPYVTGGSSSSNNDENDENENYADDVDDVDIEDTNDVDDADDGTDNTSQSPSTNALGPPPPIPSTTPSLHKPNGPRAPAPTPSRAFAPFDASSILYSADTSALTLDDPPLPPLSSLSSLTSSATAPSLQSFAKNSSQQHLLATATETSTTSGTESGTASGAGSGTLPSLPSLPFQAQSPRAVSSPEAADPPTPSSIGSSLRRKLSLSWKRSNKSGSGSHHGTEDKDAKDAKEAKEASLALNQTLRGQGSSNTTNTMNGDPTKQSQPQDSRKSSHSSSHHLHFHRRQSSFTSSTASASASSRQQQQQHDGMPPPPPPQAMRIPVSSTLNALKASPTPAGLRMAPGPDRGTASGSMRRKTSASSLNAIVVLEGGSGGHSSKTSRTSNSWTVSERYKKAGGEGAATTATTSTTSLATVTANSQSLHSQQSVQSLQSQSSHSNMSVMQKILKPKVSASSLRQQQQQQQQQKQLQQRGHGHSRLLRDGWPTADLDKDDLVAEEEMRKLGMRRKETELAARTLDALRKRATPKERVSPQEAIRIAMLNIYERGEIVDYNDVYFCGTQNAAKVVGNLLAETPNFGYDDERGDYSIVPGDHLAYRYEIIDLLGKGSFGQVVRCIDHKTGVLVAVKIIRNKKRFHQQALVEVNILQKLREWDPHNKHSMVNFTHSFYFRGHLCISTELLDMNLYEFTKANGFRGFSLKMIRRFTKQLLGSLLLLKQHRVIHCDLKPENILLRHPLHTELKMIDFGSSCFDHEKVYTYIQSRFYRSPEVILGMTYGLPIDMWSLGCILAELYTGVPIFPGENEQEQLACIMEVFGPPEKHLIEKSTRKKLFFDSMGKPRLTVSSKGRRRRPSSKTLQQAIKCDDEPFLDFLGRCLRWDPERRIKPEEAVRHEFITGIKAPPAATITRVGSTNFVSVSSRRDASPVRRHNTVAGIGGGSGPRPLPEPPKHGGTGPLPPPTLRTAGYGTGSPHKSNGSGGPTAPTASSARRASAIAAGSFGSSGSGGAKRTSGRMSASGAGSGSTNGGSSSTMGSSLPRASGRIASGSSAIAKAEAAAAATAATAAMTRRA